MAGQAARRAQLALMSDKVLSLQILRALAAWSVVFHHFAQLVTGGVSDITGFFYGYGMFGVDVFFVLSGYVMHSASQRGAPLRFLAGRIKRVVPPYWFFTLLIAACIVLFPRGFTFTSFTPSSLLASMFFWAGLPTLTVGWSLSYEMFFYFVLAGCMLATRRATALLCCVTILLVPQIFSLPPATGWLLAEFAIGMALAAWPRPAAVLVLAAFLLQPSMTTAAGVVVLVALWSERFIDRDAPAVRALVALGDWSYSTYLSHVIVLGVLVHVFGQFGATTIGHEAMLVLAVLGTVGISAASFYPRAHWPTAACGRQRSGGFAASCLKMHSRTGLKGLRPTRPLFSSADAMQSAGSYARWGKSARSRAWPLTIIGWQWWNSASKRETSCG